MTWVPLMFKFAAVSVCVPANVRLAATVMVSSVKSTVLLPPWSNLKVPSCVVWKAVRAPLDDCHKAALDKEGLLIALFPEPAYLELKTPIAA